MFEYHQDKVTGRWVVVMDHETEITDFATEQEAIDYCKRHNYPQ